MYLRSPSLATHYMVDSRGEISVLTAGQCARVEIGTHYKNSILVHNLFIYQTCALALNRIHHCHWLIAVIARGRAQ